MSELEKIGARPGHAKIWHSRVVGCVIVSFYTPNKRKYDANTHRSQRSVRVCVTLPVCLELCMTVSRGAAPLSRRGHFDEWPVYGAVKPCASVGKSLGAS